MNQWQRSLFLAVCLVLGIAPGVLAEGKPISRVQPQQPITDIPSLSEVEQPLTTAQRLLVQQPAPAPAPQPTPAPTTVPTLEVVQVRGVQANPTDKGVEVILQTTQGKQLQVVNRSADNSYIADIPNAQLRLPSGEAFVFRSQKPITGITEITVTNFNANTMRVTVTGEAGVPTVELFDSPEEGLIFSVVSAAASTPPQQPPQTQPTPLSVEPGSEAQPDEPLAEGEEEIEIVVTGEQETGYRVPNATTGTRTDTPLRNIPQSIQVVPRQVLQDQQVNNLGEALRNVPGVAQGVNSSSRGQFEQPVIRGFRSTDNILKNGLQDNTNNALSFEAAGIERIEVLKGPASVLYGQGSLGGVVNLVTKKPFNEPYYSLEGSAGNFNFYRGAIDLSGPLNNDKTVLYRLNLAAQTTESFLDFYEEQKYFVAPVVTWLINDRTKLTLASEYIDRPKSPGQQGIPAVGSVLPNSNGKIPLNRNISEPSDRDDQRAFRVGYDLEHRFSKNWQLRNAFRASWLNLDRDYVFSTALESNNRSLNRQKVEGESDYRSFNFDTYVVGKFSTGGIEHQLVTGFNYNRLETDGRFSYRQVATLDLFNPVYSLPLGALIPSRAINNEFGANTFGFYVQDQIALAENFKLVLGGRFDIANQKGENIIAGTSQFRQQEVFSPRVGFVYQPIPPISLYANYSKSFAPNAFADQVGLPQPERGTQYEVGVKADLSDRSAATLAFYDLIRSNVLTNDPSRPGLIIQVGEQRSRGIEFDISGEILPGWNIIAGYAYTDARIEEDRNFAVGNLLNNVPQHSFNLWTTYEIQSGKLKGLGLGVGLFYVGERQGDLANTFELPSYFRTDAAIFYKLDRFRAAINFKNLFDVNYFESTNGNRLSVFPGDPFTVQSTISWEF